jgi:uncharacterized membrane protein YjjP (DUF1212 family)
MINLKTKIVKTTDEGQCVKVTKYKVKHTSTLEHICAINLLVRAIMDNEDDMSITELCKLIKENYKTLIKEEGE